MKMDKRIRLRGGYRYIKKQVKEELSQEIRQWIV
jgi:hypothetical protein